MRSANFIRIELKRQFCLLRRYPVQAASNAAGLFIISTVAWFGLRAAFFANQDYRAVSSVLLWPIVMAALGLVSASLQEDMALGTIEQLYIASPSVLPIMHCRALVYLFFSTAMTFPLWLLGMYYLGGEYLMRWLVYSIGPLLLTVYGLGLIVGGLTLVYRRTGELVNLVVVGLMALTLVQVPWSTHWAGMVIHSALPMVDTSNVANAVNWSEVLLRYGAGGVYFAIGQSLFRRAELKAKQLGVIGHY